MKILPVYFRIIFNQIPYVLKAEIRLVLYTLPVFAGGLVVFSCFMHAGKTDALSLKKEFKPPAVMSIPQMNLFAYRITRPPDQARKPEHKLLEGYRLKEIISINSQRKALVTDASGADIYIPRPGYIIKNYIVIAIEEDRIILADMTGNSGHISNHAANPSIPKFYIQK